MPTCQAPNAVTVIPMERWRPEGSRSRHVTTPDPRVAPAPLGMTLLAILTMVGWRDEAASRSAPAADPLPPATRPSTGTVDTSTTQPMSVEDAMKLIDARPEWTETADSRPASPRREVPARHGHRHRPRPRRHDGGDNTTQPPGYKARAERREGSAHEPARQPPAPPAARRRRRDRRA